MLRLRIRIERIDGEKNVEAIAIANSGFSSPCPVIIDPADGLWCFRDELGVKMRRGV